VASGALADAYALLRAGRAADALGALDALADLAPADEGRRLAWRGQALRALGRPEEGARDVIAAIRVARAAGDAAAVEALRALHAELHAPAFNRRNRRGLDARGGGKLRLGHFLDLSPDTHGVARRELHGRGRVDVTGRWCGAHGGGPYGR